MKCFLKAMSWILGALAALYVIYTHKSAKVREMLAETRGYARGMLERSAETELALEAWARPERKRAP